MVDAARDIVHINWDPVADIDWMTYHWGDPVRCVALYAAQTEVQRASVRIEFLEYMRSGLCDELQYCYRWTRSELATLMRAQAPSLSWTVVIMEPIIVHATTTVGSGLFGLLGDAPV